MTWLPVEGDGVGPPTLASVLAQLAPAAGTRLDELVDRLWSGTHVDAATLDLVRIRIAQLLGCEVEAATRHPAAAAAGLDDRLVAELARWPSSERFDDGRCAALRFAEQYVIDPHGLEDDDVDRLRARWSEASIATIVLATAVSDARCRMHLALGTHRAVGATTATAVRG